MCCSLLRNSNFPLALVLFAVTSSISQAADSTSVQAQFQQPPREFSSGPLWVWNDLLTEDQIVSTLEDLAAQHVKQAFVHPRPGLMTPYLGDDWFRLWRRALKEAERLDMNIWIYDENSYPSGFAGGLVPDAMPEARGKGLNLELTTTLPEPSDEIVAVFSGGDAGYEQVTKAFRGGESLPAGPYLVASIRLAPTRGWFGGKSYVDLLKPGVTEKFLEITMDAYQRELGDQFGKRVPGVFTDEPHLAPAGGLHWSDHLPELFQERWGYDLLDHLPSLVRPVGDWRKVRHNYYQLLLEQFIDCWAKPFYEYCEQHELEFTGHYWEHGWPGAGHGGDNMAMYAWHQRPAIDILMNQYREDTHAQFGNVRAVLELGSVANQMGRRRTLCEVYGAGGWELRFEDMKRIGDWMYVLGVNTMNEHLSYITVRGARKRDHPQSFSYHTPWWEGYHVMADYFTRLSLVLSAGEQRNSILLLEPTSTSWMYQSDPQLAEIGDSFQTLVTEMAQSQVEFDIGCEDIMARFGSVDGAALVVGQRSYSTVVLPPKTENLNTPTVKLLKAYLDAGGVVLNCGSPAARVDGRISDRAKDLAQHEGYAKIGVAEAVARLLARSSDGFSLRCDNGDSGVLYHHRRRMEDGEFLFLTNTSIEAPCAGEVHSPARGIEAWDLQTGNIAPYTFQSTADGVTARFALPPCGSLMLFLAKGQRAPADPVAHTATAIAPVGTMTIERAAPNVLTLDYVDIRVGDVSRKDLYFYKASQLVFQQHGMESNPWDSAVQFRDELIRTKFPAESGFEATYRFTIQDRLPKQLEFVVERPDLYTIDCNGQPVEAEAGQWWLDRSFGRIDIAAAARLGENAVTIKASPMTIYHELEPAYVLGDFALEATDAGFAITADRPPRLARGLAHGNQVEGTNWLTSGIGYRRDPEQAEGNDGDPYIEFDLGKPRRLAGIHVWNYGEVNLTRRGAKDVRILGSTSGDEGSFTIPLGTVQLAQAQGDEGDLGQRLAVQGPAVRFIRFEILSNHSGVKFPTQGKQPDDAFVGLSEVRFFAVAGEGAAGKAVSGVQVHSVSSELTGSHNRRGSFVVDGSGLNVSDIGWNRQGHPFYAEGVNYGQSFEIPDAKGRYVVTMPRWNGSVARVQVNGKQAGYVAYQPWQFDVTPWIRPGKNRIQVKVIGTLKNTLGPHHAGALRGAAWPHMFQRAPETGPPPGRQYDTIRYGLFGPFTLTRQGP